MAQNRMMPGHCSSNSRVDPSFLLIPLGVYVRLGSGSADGGLTWHES